MTGVSYKIFVKLHDLVAFMNTVAVTTVIQIVHDASSGNFVIIYK